MAQTARAPHPADGLPYGLHAPRDAVASGDDDHRDALPHPQVHGPSRVEAVVNDAACPASDYDGELLPFARPVEVRGPEIMLRARAALTPEAPCRVCVAH